MSSQNLGTCLSSWLDSPMKRKRGRPRRVESVQGDTTPVTPESDSLKKNKRSVGASDPSSADMVGQMVSGVIEGSFDAGYLLNVKVGDTSTHLRGVVFLPGQFTPITGANDVAPHAKMYERKEIPIPFINPQGYLHVVSLSGKSEKPVEDKNDVPNIPEEGLHSGLQSGASAASESQSAPILIPPAGNLPINESGLPWGQKVLQEQILDSGLHNGKAVGQHQLLQGFETFKLLKGPNIKAKFTATLPTAETINLKPQVENQVMSSDLKPQELVHDDVKSLDFGNKQTPKSSEPEPQAVACDTGINIFRKQPSSRQDIDISQDPKLELAKKITNGANTSHMDGLSASDAVSTTVTTPCSASMTSLPVMIFGAETIPSEPKPDAEESVLPGMVVPEVNDSLMAAFTNNVESNAKDAIAPAHS